MEIKTLSYEEIVKAFGKLETDSLRMKIILMKAIFGMQNVGTDINRRFERANILESQDRDEKLMSEETKLRFFRKYFDTIPNVPDAINIGSAEVRTALRYKMPPCLSTEIRIPKPTREEYMEMSEEDKKKLVAQLYREAAVISARKVNAQNRRKEEYQKRNENPYTEKSVYVEEFLKNVQLYNSMVQESEQICFGFSEDPQSHLAVLTSSLPGYTRMSVHLGGSQNANSILTNVNKTCKERGLPEFPLQKSKLYTQYKYPLERYEINTGLVNFDDMLSKGYEQQIGQISRLSNGKMDTEKMNQFSMFMYPEFNLREVLYLAEKAGLGRGVLVQYEEIEKRKQKIKKQISKPEEIRRRYLRHKVKKAETKEEKLGVLKSLWEAYQMIEDAQGEKQYITDCFTTYFEWIYDMELEPDVLESFTGYALDNLDEFDLTDLLNEAGLSTIQNVLMSVDSGHQARMLEKIQEVKEDREELSGINLDNLQDKETRMSMYQKIKGIAGNTTPNARDEAENLEAEALGVEKLFDT